MNDVNVGQENVPTIDEILADPATSRWLKVALLGALDRDAVDALNDAEILAKVLGKRWEQISNASNWLGPQRVGGEYFCGYWRLRYKVISIAENFSSITVLWEDGRTTTHATPWDNRHDKVLLADPDPPVKEAT